MSHQSNRPTLLHRLSEVLRLAKRKELRRQNVQRLHSPPQFTSSDKFGFVPLVLDVNGLDINFRVQHWGGFGVAGRCTVIVMHYATPSFDSPSRTIELYQRNLAESNVIPDWQISDERWQQDELTEHQRLYPLNDREAWFFHASKRTVTLEAMSTTTTIMDSWHGPKRTHQIFRTFAGSVAWHTIFGGFLENEALEILQQRLIFVNPKSRLAKWHDEQHRKHADGPFHI